MKVVALIYFLAFFSPQDSFIRYKLEEPNWDFSLDANNLPFPIGDFHCGFVLLLEYLDFSKKVLFFLF